MKGIILLDALMELIIAQFVLLKIINFPDLINYYLLKPYWQGTIYCLILHVAKMLLCDIFRWRLNIVPNVKYKVRHPPRLLPKFKYAAVLSSNPINLSNSIHWNIASQGKNSASPVCICMCMRVCSPPLFSIHIKWFYDNLSADGLGLFCDWQTKLLFLRFIQALLWHVT